MWHIACLTTHLHRADNVTGWPGKQCAESTFECIQIVVKEWGVFHANNREGYRNSQIH